MKQGYYDNIEGLLEYLKEVKEMYPSKSLTEIISLVCDMPVTYQSDSDLMDSLKKHILQNM